MSRRTVYDKVVSVTISNGQSLSPEVDLEHYEIAAVEIPPGFLGSLLSFQVATEAGGTYVDLYSDSGDEVVAAIAASRRIGLDSIFSELRSARFLKIRAGSVVSPTNQSADRIVKLLAKGI